MRIRALTVTEVNTYLKRILNQDPILSRVQVRGEISNYKLHTSGHAYFAIKDQQSKLNCVMFKQSTAGLDFKPADGMSVIATGRISIYERDGKYQLYVDALTNEGKGDLYVAFERLKKELNEAGYFDDSLKKKLPLLPKRVGIVTSPTGAAIRDILSVLGRRNKAPEVTIYPARVQGETASSEIANGIAFFNNQKPVDVIILARGGGSIEELWAFNERMVADAIYQSKIPVISGVGHETDFTISDFTADYRAATPSAAAETVVPDAEDLNTYLDHMHHQMKIALLRKSDVLKHQLEQINPLQMQRSLLDRIKSHQQEIDYAYNAIHHSNTKQLSDAKSKLDLLGQSLHLMSPLNQLENGYGIVTNQQGDSISKVSQVKPQEVLDIYLNDGKLVVAVNECEKGAIWHDKEKNESGY